MVELVAQFQFQQIGHAADGDMLVPQFMTERLLIAGQELFQQIEAKLAPYPLERRVEVIDMLQAEEVDESE